MKITLAKTAGFCYGVRRAVDLALKCSTEKKACTLGPIIHNHSVVERLAENGCLSVDTPAQVPEGHTVIIRSHGVGQEVYEAFRRRGIQVEDATCPHVKKIHQIVSSAADEGRTVLIIGSKNHPEVIGISGWCRDAKIFSEESEVTDWLREDPKNREKPLTVVSQTTFQRKIWENCAARLKKECTNVRFFDTICYATDSRRAEAALIAAQSDLMIVVGDRQSSNSRHLAEFCRERCPSVFLVEDVNGLAPVLAALRPGMEIGMTAGASAPAWVIKEVYDKMTEEIKEMVEETKVEATTAAAPAAEEEMSFAELLEQSIKTLNTGDKVVGVITGITPTELQVDLGTKHSGYVPLAELSDDPSFKADEVYKVGDEIETFVVRVNDVEGTAMLSKKRLDAVKGWEEVEAAVESKEVLEGVVTEENKGGIVANVKGVRVFIPASQSGRPRGADLSEMLKEKVSLRITEVNRARRRVVGSIRSVLQEVRKEMAEKVWAEIEEGKVYDGTVKSLTSYGAFVDIGGVDGMVHISELSWSRIKNPAEVVSVGDKIQVYVISFDKEKKKISLGYRRSEDNPWNKFTTAYKIGDVATVKVVKLMNFGAFAEVVPGVDGLIHISQIADHHVARPGDELTEGQELQVKITDIDYDNKKISLSARALLEEGAAAPEEAAETPDAE